MYSAPSGPSWGDRSRPKLLSSCGIDCCETSAPPVVRVSARSEVSLSAAATKAPFNEPQAAPERNVPPDRARVGSPVEYTAACTLGRVGSVIGTLLLYDGSPAFFGTGL